MNSQLLRLVVSIATACLISHCLANEHSGPPRKMKSGIDLAQVPKWSSADLDFFLHGSMSTEVVPERVLQAFIRTYPDLFPKDDLSNFGLIPDAKAGLPIGVSRRSGAHLGGLP